VSASADVMRLSQNDLTAGGADAERPCPEGPGGARAPAGRYPMTRPFRECQNPWYGRP